MRVTILTIGTTGWVLPFIALGRGLQARGHSVRIATHRRFEELIRQHGLDFAPIAGDPQEILEGREGQRLLSGHPLIFWRHLQEIIGPLIDQGLRDLWQASQDTDLLVYGLLVAPAARNIVACLRVPGVLVSLFPAEPSRYLRPALAPAFPWRGSALERLYNRMLPVVVWEIINHAVRLSLKRWTEETLGLPPTSLTRPFHDLPEPDAVLFAYSPSVLQRPTDWPDRVAVTGYWWTDFSPRWRPPWDLLAFLEGGPPPVYVGFGSMVGTESRSVLAVILEALRRTRQRAVLLTGWGGLAKGDVPNTVFVADSAPHDWLFGRVAAVVHHGGAGTTSAGLRAGVPTVAVPFFEDQFFWGRRVEALGVGPRPIRQKDLTAAGLAAAIDQAVHDPDMRTRAVDLARRIGQEDGVGTAVQIIESVAARHRARGAVEQSADVGALPRQA